MMGRNVLVLVLDEGFEPHLRRALAQRDGRVHRVHVVAPTRLGRLDWLANAEDAARRAAGRRARHAERSVAVRAVVDSEVGESDTVLAVEDALRVFPADEIVVVAPDGIDDHLDSALTRFGLPVEQLPATAPRRSPGVLGELTRGLARGRSRRTPAVLFAGVNLFLIAVGAVVALILVLAIRLS
jgi:hypothetical protein